MVDTLRASLPSNAARKTPSTRSLTRKCCPSGKKCGQRNPEAFCSVRKDKDVTSPPEAEIRQTGPPVTGTNTTIPLVLQVPPRGFPASARMSGVPVDTSIRLSLRSAKKPSDCPSGDQNAAKPPAGPSEV